MIFLPIWPGADKLGHREPAIYIMFSVPNIEGMRRLFQKRGFAIVFGKRFLVSPACLLSIFLTVCPLWFGLAQAKGLDESTQINKLITHARQSTVKAKVLGNKMTAQQANDFFDEADQLIDRSLEGEARELLLAVCATKLAEPRHFRLLSRTYKTEMGDNEKGRPANFYLDKALALDPNYSEAWVEKAKLALIDGDLDKGMKFVDRALACKPPDSDCAHVKANILATKKQFKEALPWIEQAVKLYPDAASVYRDKGTILENLNRYDEAIAAYKMAYQIKRQDWTIFQIVRCLETQKKYVQGIETLNLLLKDNPNDGEAFRARARLKTKNKDLAGALRDISQTIELEPTSTSYLERAKIYRLLGDQAHADADMKKAKSISDSPF